MRPFGSTEEAYMDKDKVSNLEMRDGLVYLTEEAAKHFQSMTGEAAVQGVEVDQWRAYVSAHIHAASAKGQFHAIYANLLTAYLPPQATALDALSNQLDATAARTSLRGECVDLLEGVARVGGGRQSAELH